MNIRLLPALFCATLAVGAEPTPKKQSFRPNPEVCRFENKPSKEILDQHRAKAITTFKEVKDHERPTLKEVSGSVDDLSPDETFVIIKHHDIKGKAYAIGHLSGDPSKKIIFLKL